MAASMPALGQGRGNGQGKGGGNPHAAHSGGGGGQHAEGRGNGRGNQAQRERSVERHARGNGHGRGHAEVRQLRAERGQGNGRAQGQVRQAERRAERAVRQADRHAVRDVRRVEQQDRRLDRRLADRDWNEWLSRRASRDERLVDRVTYFREGRPLPVRAAAANGCPPGLAKQNAFCLPPGQLRRAPLMGQRIDASRFDAVPEDWRYRFRDDDEAYYRYDDDGYVYRIDRDNDLVSAIIPLFGSGLLVGEPLPIGYDTYNLPVPYRDQYVDSDEWLYRYDDGAIYQVDAQTRLIEGVVALLAGNSINVGSPLPSGYDAYNLPLEYRDRYVDDADSLYRYANGGIYQVDPTTMLVQSLVEMII